MGEKKKMSKARLSESTPNPANRRLTRMPWKPTILVAEDSADTREMMQVLLQIRGYNVVAADNGIHALEVAVKNEPDAVLLDLQLPIMDGLSVTRSLRSHPALKTVPIIIISGHDPEPYRQRAIDAGSNEYLLKPIDFDRLQSVLDRFVPRERRARVKCA
jgi:CheY-like chemotaxis protein